MENQQRNKKCPACHKVYVSMNTAQKHIRKKHPQCTESPVILWQNASAVPNFQVPVKPAKKKICKICPHWPEFDDKAERRQHVKAVHKIKCPICPAFPLEKSFATHLQKIHGISSSAAQLTDRTVPQFTSNSAPAESPYPALLCQTSGEVGEPCRRAGAPLQNGESSVLLGACNMLALERFYCQEYECGRGFSSKAHLESHTRFFHPRKPTQTAAAVLPSDIPGADEESVKHSPVYSSPASTASYPHPGEPAIQDSPDPVETYMPVLRREGHQGAELNTGEGVQQTHESPLEPPTTSQTDVHEMPAVTASTPLSLQCRICAAPPTVGTRPTATMCGHLFCSECITRHVISTSKCPVCDNALLLYCLFKLDLSVSS